MKSSTLVFVILIALTGLAYPIQTVNLSNTPSGAQLLSQDQSGINLRVDVGELTFNEINTSEGQFTLVTSDGLGNSQKIGEPNLPILNRLISIPYGCELQCEVTSSEYQDISLSDLNLTNPIMPVQPPLSKGVDPATVPFEYNRGIYEQSGYYSQQLATTQILGVMRAMRMGMVSIAPIQYNPLEKTLRVYKNVTVRVTYLHPDWTTTRQTWQRLDSPVFSSVYGQVFN